MRSLLFCILFFTHTLLSAQSCKGWVKGKDGVVLGGASVVVVNEAKKPLAYCITSDEGEFTLNIKEESAKSVVVSFMGYEKKSIPMSEMKNGMTITLSAGGFTLKEVKIKAQRIQSTGDTLTYSVAGFRQTQDRSIADVIRKMPGLEVKDNGQVEYQGKAINKFYIEGLDLMGSQYGVANNNLAADKIQSVQVLENHQAVKSLRGVTFSEQAAINLVLKDDAKAVWSGTADIGFGYAPTMETNNSKYLYDCRLMGMRFNKRFQTLMMYKNNDTGKSIGDEVLDLAALLREHSMPEDGLLSMMDVSTPGISHDRYTFNHSHLVAGNWIWKLSKDSELRVQGNGFIDQSNLQSYHSITYLDIAGLPVVTEEQQVTNERNEWKGEVNYQYNGTKTYISNNMRGYIDFNKSTGTMLYNDGKTPLSVKPHKRNLSDDFRLSHTTGKGNVYELSSYTKYDYLPGLLLTVNGITEHLNLSFFSTQNYLRYKLKLGRHYLNNQIGADYQNQNIGIAMDDDKEESDAYKLFQAYWQPSMSFIFVRHRLDAVCKLSYAHQAYKLSKSKHFWAEPTLNWNWKASAVSEFSATMAYRTSPIMGKNIFSTPVFTSYRTQRVYRGETDVQHTASAQLAYKYSNPVTGVFFNIRPMMSRTSGNYLYKSSIVNNVYLIEASDKKYASKNIGISSRISKTLGWAKTLIGLGGSYNIAGYSMLLNDKVNDARMQSTSLYLDYSLCPVHQFSIEGKSSIYVNKQKNLTHQDLSSGSTTVCEHNLSFHIFPAKGWMITMSNELFHSSERSFGTNYFCNLALSYKAKRWELSLNANNIIGTSIYETRTLGNTIESYSLTYLRPRDFVAKWSLDL